VRTARATGFSQRFQNTLESIAIRSRIKFQPAGRKIGFFEFWSESACLRNNPADLKSYWVTIDALVPAPSCNAMIVRKILAAFLLWHFPPSQSSQLTQTLRQNSSNS